MAPPEASGRRRKGPWWMLLLVLTLGLGGFGAFSGGAAAVRHASRPQFCNSCHEMQREYQGWKTSAHRDVSCVDCHIEPGIWSEIKHHAGALDQAWLHFTNQVPAWIRLSEPVSDRICRRCHAEEAGPGDVSYRIEGGRRFAEQVSPNGEVKPVHRSHVEQKQLTCTACHAGISHGLLSVRFLDPETRELVVKYRRAGADVQSISDDHRPQMAVCIDCHRQEDVIDRCNLCHLGLKPGEHDQQDFGGYGHSDQFLAPEQTCTQCHTDRQCEDCHRKLNPVRFSR